MMTETLVVIGTGYVELPATPVWAKTGLKVVGEDINDNIARAIHEGMMLIREARIYALLNDPVAQSNRIARHSPVEGGCLRPPFPLRSSR